VHVVENLAMMSRQKLSEATQKKIDDQKKNPKWVGLLKNIIRFAVFILFQVYVLNKIPHLHRFITPYLYYLFIFVATFLYFKAGAYWFLLVERIVLVCCAPPRAPYCNIPLLSNASLVAEKSLTWTTISLHVVKQFAQCRSFEWP